MTAKQISEHIYPTLRRLADENKAEILAEIPPIRRMLVGSIWAIVVPILLHVVVQWVVGLVVDWFASERLKFSVIGQADAAGSLIDDATQGMTPEMFRAIEAGGGNPGLYRPSGEFFTSFFED